MRLDLTYFGRSRVEKRADAMALMLSPNLSRAPVSFEAELARPLRFREAVSALHEVVVGDLRWKPRDHTAYRAWLKKQAEQESLVRKAAFAEARKDLEMRSGQSFPPGLDRDFKKWHKIYWDARRAYADELRKNDPELFRRLTPCDPVITVSPDVVFFECFSADESSYGCLTVERDAMFKGASATAKVTDFGLSQALNQVDRSPLEGMVAGTPEYISPEQLLGQRPDQRSDLYSLGVTLFEMLCGESPFKDPSQAVIFERHLEASRTALLRRLPQSAGPLIDVVGKLMARHPRNRPQSARELLAELRPLLQKAPRVPDIHTALLRIGRARCERGSRPTRFPS